MLRRVLVVVGIALAVTSIVALAEGSDATLRSELETLHASWFKAFDTLDGATMDQMEMDNLKLVMPTGSVWSKTRPRAGIKPKNEPDPQIKRTLTDVSVRRFGDAAVLTGILTTKSAKESSQAATTVVFVQNSGKWKVASAQWTPVASTK